MTNSGYRGNSYDRNTDNIIIMLLLMTNVSQEKANSYKNKTLNRVCLARDQFGRELR